MLCIYAECMVNIYILLFQLLLQEYITKAVRLPLMQKGID